MRPATDPSIGCRPLLVASRMAWVRPGRVRMHAAGALEWRNDPSRVAGRGTCSVAKDVSHVRSPRRSSRPAPDPFLALPRRPETSLLHRKVREHLETFLARAEDRGGVPRFVEREMRRFLECGIAAHSFVRVHCGDCGHDRLVPFS